MVAPWLVKSLSNGCRDLGFHGFLGAIDAIDAIGAIGTLGWYPMGAVGFA